MRKINFKKAFSQSAGAFAGGVAAGFVVDQLGTKIFPDNPRNASFIPVILGAFLSTQKNEMISAAGLGMVGAMANTIAADFGLTISGPSRLNAGNQMPLLTPREQVAMRELVNARAEDSRMNGAGYDFSNAYNNAVNAAN